MASLLGKLPIRPKLEALIGENVLNYLKFEAELA